MIMTGAPHADLTHGISDDKQNVQPMIQRRLPPTSESVYCDCPNSMRRNETMLTMCAISIDIGQAHVWVQHAVPTQSPQLPRPNTAPRRRHRARAPAQTATTSQSSWVEAVGLSLPMSEHTVMLQKPRLLAQAYRHKALNTSNAGAHWTHALHPLAQPHAASTRTTRWSPMQSYSRVLFLRRMRSQEKATSCTHPLLTRHFQLPCTSPQAATGGGAVKSRSRDRRSRDEISP